MMGTARLRGFWRDRRAASGLTFAIAAIPVIAIVGSAVDYSRALAQRNNLQQATDAAVLAIAHTQLNQASTSITLTPQAQAYLNGRVKNVTLNSIQLSQNNTQICMTTALVVPTAIMTVVGIKTMNVGTTACAQVPSTSEVALVLDNSGSMTVSAGGQSKIQALIAAATQAIDILIPSGTTNPQVAISITPFTALVNVGTSRTAAFLDIDGRSSIHWQNFHRPTSSKFVPKSKLDLFDAMTNVSWGGCVEERPYPYTVTDTAAATGTPDTLFVPFLAPDEPGPYNGAQGASNLACYPSSSAKQPQNQVPPGWNQGDIASSYSNGYCGRYYPPFIFENSYLNDHGATNAGGNCATDTADATADNATGTNALDGTTNVYPGSGMTMVCKYKGATPQQQSQGTGITSGPNFLCSSQQLTPLTTNATTLKNAIGSMRAGGSTDLATGFMWGWRSISPVVNPFPVQAPVTIGPQNPKPYTGTNPPNNKYIILMTDGFNSWGSFSYSPWVSTYEAFGYIVNNRLGAYNGTPTTDGNYRDQMDAVTLQACQNAKNAGVTIFTIGFSVSSDPIDAQGIKLLTKCASGDANYYPASDSTTIKAAFQNIAAQIQNLRLSR